MGDLSSAGALQLSREYFFQVALPSLTRRFPTLTGRLAAGLAGNGSECFGYDDEISRDHDWGVDFYIWTLEQDRDSIPELADWKDELFKTHPPGFRREKSSHGAQIAVMTCGDFYYDLIGVKGLPGSINEWLRPPEEHYSMAVNGAVFIDNPGVFTGIRNGLLRYYPEDIRRKRIAAKCMALAQTGQYNHERVAKRGDTVTLWTVLSRFTDSAIAMVYLLNKVYRPYYKWAFRALNDLPVLGRDASNILLCIAENYGLDSTSFARRQECISDLCRFFVAELKAQSLSDADDWFLAFHGESVQSRIENGPLRSLPAQYEI
jgi:hypothetical protein